MNALVCAAILLVQLQPLPRGDAPLASSAPARATAAVPAGVVDSWVGSDKLQHFWASYAVTAFAFAAARAAGAEHEAALGAGVAASAAAGIGKELMDRRQGRPISVRDLIADALGTAAAWFLLREVR